MSEAPHDFQHDVLDPVRPLDLGQRIDIYRKLNPGQVIEVKLTPLDQHRTIEAFRIARLGWSVVARAEDELDAQLARNADHAAERARYQRVSDRLHWLALTVLLTGAAYETLTVLMRGVLSLFTELPQ